MLHLENFFEKSFALLLTTPKDRNRGIYRRRNTLQNKINAI